ncbi:EamA family transporter [Candidatus Woesearchaeota archaeon]|nr:EamA family transporter [Candidatus Woesearchaeota archaeon]
MIALYILLPAMIVITLLGALGAFFFKKSSEHFSLNPFKLIKDWHFILAAVLYAISSLGYVSLLRLEKLSILYPLASLQYIWVAILGAWLLGEHITKRKILGIGIIVIGIVLIALVK